MSAGELDDRIEIQALTQTNNEGSLSESYATAATVWAYIMSAKGDEALQSAKTQSSRVIRIKIRYRTDITTKHRIVWAGENYNIIDIDRTARREGYLYMNCEVRDGV